MGGESLLSSPIALWTFRPLPKTSLKTFPSYSLHTSICQTSSPDIYPPSAALKKKQCIYLQRYDAEQPYTSAFVLNFSLQHSATRVTQCRNSQPHQKRARQGEIFFYHLTISAKHRTEVLLQTDAQILLCSVKHICTYSGALLSFSTTQDPRAAPAAGCHSGFRLFSHTSNLDT